METPWEEYDEETSYEEQQLLRFQKELEPHLKAAHLGVDMEQFVNADPAGKALIEHAVDTIHVSMMFLLENDLDTESAKRAQIEGRAAKLVLDWVKQTLESGGIAATQIAQMDNEINARLEDDNDA